ncbi:hypothetical protein BDN67DRAFT_972122 [Paxillus ammoniavirescens]|nr:hypothetical protein BDN67DRAFT_972122 [Paxillus ammoniavirescens]
MTVLNPLTFAASRLADSDGLSDALTMLESCLTSPDSRLDLILQDLCSVPNLFEFVISVWPRAGSLVVRILNAFPFKPALVQTTFASTLLLRLSSVLFALPPDLFSNDTLREIGRSKVYVEDALPVLSLLCSSDFTNCATAGPDTHEVALDKPEYDDDIAFFVRVKKQKKQRRKNKECGPTIDAAPFHKLGAKVPSSTESAAQMARDIADDLKLVLEFYLDLLLETALAKPFKDAYLASVNQKAIPATRPQDSKVTAEVMETTPSAYPMVQPMKAALYFDNAEGFGEWRILISTDATKKLRELTKSDRKKCAIVVKKIKQLSNGHFSEDNQKRLNSPSGVPIFEAKMQRDLRLVYQVDVIPEHDSEVERQAIKIYGIYTHTQLNRIWDAMGQHLAGKGKEYRRRCIYRNPPAHQGDDVYLPACFPPETIQIDTQPTPLVLSDKDMDELHSLLVLEKYVTFSQAFLHSLIANQDVQHVFELTPQERKIVECRASCYVLGRSGTGKTTTMLFKMLGIQRAWEMQNSGMPKPRQVFVTKSSVLATKVEEYFTKLLESLALAGYSLEELKKMKARNTTTGLVDADDVPDNRSGIPQRYSALEEGHFPLFVTFDKLARMIAADVLSGNDPETQRAARLFINTDEMPAQDSFVTYEDFAHKYWPHFPQPLTKGLEPWLVFSEFMGIIKGSEGSLSCPDGFLDEKTYCSLPPRSNPTFANQRQTVYAIFEAYCKLKRSCRHHDVADRTHAVLKMLLGGSPWKGQQVDYLYVDEAQDNLLIDTLLLRLICRNPEGLFWAGDTAQTISAGSSFRFDDLKAFLYRIEADHAVNLTQERIVAQPTSFQLAINYRSHGGIVNCAHSVIELITRFWPNAIDVLQPEQGIVDGLKPVFFHGWDQDTVRYEQFLFGASGSPIEFGAQQCILVRDEAAKKKFLQEVGEIGSIMTLYESKGLEFNDVLLYNFFEDSTVDLSRWRVVLGAIEAGAECEGFSNLHAPPFERDEGRYAGVCSELKLLYVGITRARKNMWIVDKSERCEPMRYFWSSRGQVQNHTPSTDVPHLAVSSTPEEWEAFGRSLFLHKRYTQAMHCFERASLPREVKVAKAYHLRELARASIGVTSPSKQHEAFRIAAEAFRGCGENFKTKERLQYYRNAADCYIRAGDGHLAAEAYVNAEEYELAAKQFRKLGNFGKTLHLVNAHAEKMAQESADDLLMVCRLYYSKEKGSIRPPELLFETFEEELDFLETYDFDVALGDLLESHGRFVQAAELQLSENRPLEAVKLFLKDKANDIALGRAGDILLENLWRHCSFGVSVKDAFQDDIASQVFAMIKEVPLEKLAPQNRDQILMFQAVAEQDRQTLEKLATSFQEKGDDTAALWSLDHFFARLPILRSATLQELTVFLGRYYAYARLLFVTVSHNDPIGDHSIRKLMGITEVSKDEFTIHPGAFLSRQPASTTNDAPASESQSSFSRQTLTRLLRDRMRDHLQAKVDAENKHCCEATVFSQCLSYIMTRNNLCNYVGCPQEHVPMTALDQAQYNARVGAHLQQMRILQLMYSAAPHMRRSHHVKTDIADWLNHLYEAFFPPVCYQGSIADIDWSTIQDAPDGIRVMREWVRAAIYSLDIKDYPELFLTSILRLTKLSFAFDELDPLQYLTQAACVKVYRPQELLRGPDKTYVVEDMLTSIQALTYTSISSGILYLHHITQKRLYVNLSVLCDCAEEVCGSIIIAWHLNRPGLPPLHGLVLPRSWLIGRNKFGGFKDMKMIYLFLDVVQGLLDKLRQETPEEIYWLEHTKITMTHRNIFIQRICRMLCLLAHNAYTHDIRSRVIVMMSHLRSNDPERVTAFFFRRFTEISLSRDGFLRALQYYDNQSVIEGFVQLVHKSKKFDTRSISPRIKQIVFEKVDEIPILIAPHLVAVRSVLRADAPAFVPRVVHAAQVEPVGRDEEDAREEGPAELLDALPEQQQRAHDAAFSPVVDKLIRPAEPSDVQVAAARVFQVAYRKRSERLRRSIRTGISAERHAIFEACLKHVESSGWEPSPYRFLYLGPFPHLLLALEKGAATAHAIKAKTKGRWMAEGHERLEELGRQRSEIASLLKKSANLRKKLDPGAPFHKQRDMNALKLAVSEVKEFIQALPGGSPEALQEINIAYRGIVAEKPLVTKKVKPSLNVEDVDTYF